MNTDTIDKHQNPQVARIQERAKNKRLLMSAGVDCSAMDDDELRKAVKALQSQGAPKANKAPEPPKLKPVPAPAPVEAPESAQNDPMLAAMELLQEAMQAKREPVRAPTIDEARIVELIQANAPTYVTFTVPTLKYAAMQEQRIAAIDQAQEILADYVDADTLQNVFNRLSETIIKIDQSLTINAV
jgi:hypothetical protein